MSPGPGRGDRTLLPSVASRGHSGPRAAPARASGGQDAALRPQASGVPGKSLLLGRLLSPPSPLSPREPRVCCSGEALGLPAPFFGSLSRSELEAANKQHGCPEMGQLPSPGLVCRELGAAPAGLAGPGRSRGGSWSSSSVWCPQGLQVQVAADACAHNPSPGRRARGGLSSGPSVRFQTPVFVSPAGGSLTKLAYYSTVQHKVARVRSFDHAGQDAEQDCESPYEISVQEEVTARLHFVKFENSYIEACLDFVRDHLVNTETKVIHATGGGAYKFKDLIEQKLGLRVAKEDVMTCLIKGCNFVLKNIPQEAFVYQKDADPEFRFQTNHPHIFPYLLVNIGSGVSIVKVKTEDRFEWIGGSSIGGGTFWGLGALLTKTQKFDELLHLASRGQHANVDMLVQDIYGGAHQTLGLSGNLIASSFGKSATTDHPAPEFSPEDMAKSLLHMISNDIGQLACLYARLHGLDRVYFGGFFIRGHPVTMRTITYSISFFSKGEVQALFLRHEGYLGAIGAFLKGAEQDNPDQYSWGENYAGSSGLMSSSPELGPTQGAKSSTSWKWTGWRGRWSTCRCSWTRRPTCPTRWTSRTTPWPASTGSAASRRPWTG
ncbi:PREDICTED: pantothenate kinase 4 isoform X2 [Myotis brandtii]|uniref:pantothenate kinase 4 isoform X2 n=1 Tax=Myotis brandtii TaxID=109478 RepID=UPI000703F517|nr:PREDICTED: pantothenate kinase 4 isoform X2 [Myotis brandtii]